MAFPRPAWSRSARLILRLTLSLATILLAAVATAGRVTAEDIVRLDGPVTDTTGVLAGGTSRIQSAINDARSKGIQVWVLFVRTTGDRTAEEYVDEEASANSLGVDDALLLVAIDDRTDRIWVSDGLRTFVTDPELDRIISSDLEPRLAAGDYTGAVVSAVRALGDAAAENVAPSTPAPGPSPAPASGLPGWLPLVLIVAGGGVALWSLARRRRPAPAAAAPDLARQANALLVQADEALRTGQQELGFAEAEFSQDELASFRAAIASAGAELHAAFEVRQRLDDSEPEAPPEREQMLREIVERCRRVIDGLDAEIRRIDEMREVERRAPQVLEALPASIQELEQRLPTSEQRLAGLSGYAPSVSAPVKDNVAGAQTRLEAAKKALEEGRRDERAGDQQAMRRAARLANTAVGEVRTLLDAIDRLVATIQDAESKLDAALAEAARSIDAAGPNPPESARERLAEADAQVRRARELANGGRKDPLEAYRLALEANRIADEVVADQRAAEEQLRRYVALAESSITSASRAIDQAEAYIASRRWVLGRTARTRLAEADRRLAAAQAELDSDPARAARDAQSAQQLALEALSVAQAEAEGRQPYGGLGGDFGRVATDWAPVLLPWILGQMGSRGRWSSPRGWPSPGGWPGGGGGPFGGGGGFGGRGGFGGGGGGHSRGGRW